MQKLLGISLTGLALAFLAVGSIGCQDGKKSSSASGSAATTGTGTGTGNTNTKDKDTTKDKTPKDEEVKFKAPTGKPEIAKKSGKAEIKIELTGKAHDKTPLMIKVMGGDKKEVKGITGEGEIAKGATEGTLKLTTGDTEVAAGAYTVEVHGKGVKDHASFELTVK